MELQKLQKIFLLATIIPHNIREEEALRELQELKALVEACDGKVVELVVQKREVHDKGMYLGRGKIDEVAALIKEKKIDVVVLNALVKPTHIFEIKKMLHKANPDILVWDRVDLILEIFSKHAHTAEAKLQIELAMMRHMGPRIYGMGMVLSRQSGGIGTRGIGETNTELMKRHWRDQMKKTQDKLKELATDRERQLARRTKMGLRTVSIVGYTNVGKTSLFNLLTGKGNVVENALFVTLDSSSGKVFLPDSKTEFLLTDTIGFIRNLPTKLIDAFKSTLMESISADVLLHVIDITDPDMERKIRTVEGILRELRVQNKPRIYVFNKIDNGNEKDIEEISLMYEQFIPHFISVKHNKGITTLLGKIEKTLTT